MQINPAEQGSLRLACEAKLVLSSLVTPKGPAEMQCCGEVLQVGAKFCSSCGKGHTISMCECGNTLPEKARFCSFCGHDHRKPDQTVPLFANRNSQAKASQSLADLLQAIPLFANTNIAFRNEIERSMQETKVAQNSFVVRKGDEAKSLFVVRSGEVSVVDGEGKVLMKLEEGKFFGEIALLFGGTRNASVVASKTSRLNVLEKQQLDKAMVKHSCTDLIRSNARSVPHVKEWFLGRVDLLRQAAAAEPEFLSKVATVLKFQKIAPSTNIIRQGDLGQEMYFILSGSVDVIVNGRVVKALKEGSFVGEVSLLFGDVRTATVRTKAPCEVYVLSRISFDEILEQYPKCIDAIYGAAQETKHLKEFFIKKIALFEDVASDAEFILNMSLALSSRSFRPGEDIVCEGDYGDNMFLVARGQTVVLKENKEVARLQSGQFFGELSLLYRERRNATIRAENYCHLYALSQDAFETLAVAFPRWWKSMQRKRMLVRQERLTSGVTVVHRKKRRSTVHGLELPMIPSSNPNLAALLPHPLSSLDPRPASVSLHLPAGETSSTLHLPALQTCPSPPSCTGVAQSSPCPSTCHDSSSSSAEHKAEHKELHLLQNELEKMQSQKLCLVCADRERTMLIIPCGHISVCESCVKPLKKCPICRGCIEKSIKAFF
eukprot:gb/GEZN01002586.1/.p1 GENE.gb/GEZN01002586.1/~~gb/GEZN01002586.1/.p1  ORF type:complete len:661 (+),score=85.48 gb/GEZN01002586.1/:123-2105(+)